MSCKNCGSLAINHHLHGRDGSEKRLCDVCYWRTKVTNAKLRIAHLESYINEEGERNGVCTFGILQRVCDGCGCEKGKK